MKTIVLVNNSVAFYAQENCSKADNTNIRNCKKYFETRSNKPFQNKVIKLVINEYDILFPKSINESHNMT